MSRDEIQQKALRRLNRLMATLRGTIGETIPLQIAHTFILVAQNEGKGVSELADLAGASKGTMSRHLLDLSDKLRSGEDGYGLLQRTQDPSNLRTVIYTLTAKGKLLRDNLVGILED